MMLPPCLKVCFSRIGSSAASSDSPMFSSSTARPKRTPFSSVRRKSFSLSFTTSSPCSRSMFFTHLLACPCGSIISGQRRALNRMMPFSTLTPSVGSPAIFHARTCTGSWSVLMMLVPGVCGMDSRSIIAIQSVSRSARYTGVKGPLYAMVPAATTTSPTTLTVSFSSCSTVACQRIFSPPSPPISLSARSSLTSQSATCLASASFLATASPYSCSSCAILACTVASFSCASFNSAIVLASWSCAVLSAMRLGSTLRETVWYEYMARTHWQMAVHALDTRSTTSGVNSSIWMYGSILLITACGMFSRS
mmetsp:Transcript_3424/g.8506  ORF Transcript_3424/g.8506 Transcript_3424/m.8506 type:complete len:308 (-) Transcript_3424:797-1720(-)